MKQQDQKPQFSQSENVHFPDGKIAKMIDNSLELKIMIENSSSLEEFISKLNKWYIKKQFLSEKIETFEKSFIKTLDDKKDRIYKEAKETESELMISNLSGEANAIFWVRNKILDELKQLEKSLGIEPQNEKDEK
jgi:hypothetical protein